MGKAEKCGGGRDRKITHKKFQSPGRGGVLFRDGGFESHSQGWGPGSSQERGLDEGQE